MVISKVEDIAQKIETMEIRGARKIAKAAAEALREAAKNSDVENSKQLIDELDEAGKILLDTRPSAVSLSNSVRFVTRDLDSSEELEDLRELAISRADEFIDRANEAKDKIGEIGCRRISDGDVIMTHCNSSNALSVIKTAYDNGKDIEVVATEARPRRQGYITVRELSEYGIPVTLIVDSAARHFMKEVDKVIVGADSIAANGAVVNKIGTSQIALAANEARVPTFVAAESYKFHPSTLVGELVQIEERDENEVVSPDEFSGVDIRNPAFDVTPSEYIDLIITERGIIPPAAAYEILQETFELGLEEDEFI
uniref:Translation initiation factor, aIF-2BII family n=1 Tax=uncultured organism TaxID=155900 RepID=M1P2B8_9ZZZZ|nr:translation initiation factor, aIF-2BII family [uncultured organism]